MAKINLDLSKFKSSGIYTLEFDSSESITIQSQTIRLVVGFSKKGPFNAPVYLDDIKKAKKVFGDIDPILEKRGSFFHRSLFTCLRTGPVFALNLMPLNNGQDLTAPIDKIDWRSFSVDVNESNGVTAKDLYSAFFNKQRFWTPDTEAFFALQENNNLNKGKVLSFSNIGQKPCSILVRKANVKGFNITANEWFKGNVPDFIRPFDFIADYFIEVIAVEGNWTDYSKLSTDPFFSKYFDTNGIKKDQLNAFLENQSVNQIASFVGSIIPDLIDGENRNHFIETIINNNLISTGILCNVNQDALEDYANATSKVDLIGHGLISNIINGNSNSIDFLSYSMPIKKDYLYSKKTALTYTTFTSTDFPNIKLESAYLGSNNGIFENILVIDKATANVTKLNALKTNLIEKSSVIKGKDGVTVVNLLVNSIVDTPTELRISYSHLTKASEPSKLNSVNLLSFTMPVSVGGNFVLQAQGDYNTAGPLKLNTGDVLLVQKSGWREYFTVVSTALSSGNTNITVSSLNKDLSGIDLNCKLYAGVRAKVDTAIDLEFAYTPDIFNVNTINTFVEYIAYEHSNIYKDVQNGSLKNGDKVNNGTADVYIFTTKTINSDGVSVIRIKTFSDVNLNTQISAYVFGATYDSLGGAVTSNSGNDINFISIANSINSDHSIISSNPARTEITVSAAVGILVKIGDYLVSEDIATPGVYSLTKVIDSRKVFSNTSNTFQYILTTNERVWINSNTITKFTPIEDFATNYRLTSLGGFTIGEFHMPGDANHEAAQLEKILGVLDEAQSNIMKTLASKDTITFRYIVDTFDGGLANGSYPKNLLTKLAKKRQKCMALINVPSMKKFIKSNDPLFTDLPDLTTGNLQPTLNSQYIVDGGNLSLAPSFRYTLPSEDDGSKYAGFFAPFLVARDKGKSTLVPPAAYVSNLFIKKFENGTPYAIVAGTRRGIIEDPTITGIEYEFLDEDRDNLEPFGINPIIVRKGKGIMIYGNQSGYQRTTSALNSLHVRDLLITVEEYIEDILSNYVFEFNDSSTRLQIKSIVESYLSNVQADGGIYAFTVQMDENNNTKDIIDQNTGILDITIEPAKGLHKIINRITVTKTGGASSGGFSLA